MKLDTKEFELKLRESLLEVEEVEDNYNHKIVFSASYKDLIENNKLTYLKTMISLDKIVNINKKAITLPSGNYLTMYFEDDFYKIGNKKIIKIFICAQNERHKVYNSVSSKLDKTYLFLCQDIQFV